jgi:hypothetical protein
LAPTRKRGIQDPHILDLVITTDSIIEEIQHCSPIGSSDHSVLKIVCKWAYSQQLENEPKYCYNRGDYEALNDFIMNSLQGLANSNDLEGLWINLKKHYHRWDKKIHSTERYMEAQTRMEKTSKQGNSKINKKETHTLEKIHGDT